MIIIILNIIVYNINNNIIDNVIIIINIILIINVNIIIIIFIDIINVNNKINFVGGRGS